jgi:hypothetical protein
MSLWSNTKQRIKHDILAGSREEKNGAAHESN